MAHTLFFKLPLLAFILASTSWYNGHAQLSPNFYNTTCPNLTAIVRANMTTAIQNNPRMGASILRLHFHDCFVQGCDASVLLDSGGEKTAAPNNNSLLGFDVIDTIKATVESQCGARVVSCADILALAAREGTVLLGGPSWVVGLGRRDSLTGNAAAALTDLPPPNFNLSDLRTAFTNKGLDLTDLVALSGAHTIGQSQCLNFRDRLTNDTNIDPMFRGTRNATCNAGTPDTNLAPLDVQTPNSFDNAYYQNLMQQRGLLHSDQELFNNGTADALVRNYSTNSAQFFADFANAMVKMSTISVLTGTQGQIRGNCRVVN